MSEDSNSACFQNIDKESVFGLLKTLLTDPKTTLGSNVQKTVHEKIEEIVKEILTMQYKEEESRKSADSIDKNRPKSSTSILKGLKTLEFALQQNIHGDAMVRYKGIPISQTETLDELFSFKCSMVENKYSVTSLSWHQLNSDILAVGYTCNDLKEQNPRGMVLVWTVRNPSYPEKVFQTENGVCSLAFSKERPSVLAVGLDSGCINLYDLTLSDSLVLDNFSVPGRHMSSVTNLQWITDVEDGTSEILISIGTDGKVIQWSTKNGLCPQPLITLKRHNTKSNYHRLPDVAMGMSLDFLHGNNSLTYICGAEDGTIFRCSRSYSEQYLYSVMAHNGPVTQIVTSPLEEDLFITSGADSTIKLWVAPSKHNSIKLILTVSPLNLLAPINDVAWSPVVPTIFCFVTADGRIEIWNLSTSVSVPLHTKPSMSPIMKGNEFTKVSFTTNGRTIIIGCDTGAVLTYSLPKNCYECNKDLQLVDVIKSWQ